LINEKVGLTPTFFHFFFQTAMTNDPKLARLANILKQNAPLAVAFSGGIDSTFLLAMATEILGADQVLALTISSPLHPHWELDESRKLASHFGVRQIVVDAEDILDIPEVRDNAPNRCYFCKKALFSRAIEVAHRLGFNHLADGSNQDDLADYRPGRQAVEELRVLSPLLEAGLTKQEIRHYSKQKGLANWNKPANACLATRFPTGAYLTVEGLDLVDRCESVLRKAGFAGCRARIHGKLLRIEVPADDIARFAVPEIRRQIVIQCRELGLQYVTLDLAGYQSGSMNSPERSSGNS